MFILIIVHLSLSHFDLSTGSSDKTLIPREKGESVVSTTIQKIRDSCILGNDYQFLKKVAYLESSYGHSLAGKWRNAGKAGIWNISSDKFSTFASKLGRNVKQEINTHFAIDLDLMVSSARYNFTIPLYGAFGAWIQACNNGGTFLIQPVNKLRSGLNLGIEMIRILSTI